MTAVPAAKVGRTVAGRSSRVLGTLPKVPPADGLGGVKPLQERCPELLYRQNFHEFALPRDRWFRATSTTRKPFQDCPSGVSLVYLLFQGGPASLSRMAD
jgi:hypothetical protein